MERLRLERGFFRTADGKAVYLIGANFWPKKSGPFMYRDPWDAPAVALDLDELAALGANCARLFCFWPDFMPTAGAVSADALARLDQMIGMCAKRGMWSIPTLFVGHMSGENWDPPWRAGRDLYTDEAMLEGQEVLARSVAAKYKEDPRIAAWLVTNEWPLYAGETSDERGITWTQRICAALRAADPDRAVSLGDGAWDLVWGQSTGLPAPRLTSFVDFLGPHFYPKETDSLRHSLVAPFAMRMCAPLGRPVLLEEFGCSSDQADDDDAADYYRTTLYAAFGAANCGALAWNSHDFELQYRRPYSHHPYELHFGLIRTDGTRKPQAQVFAEFAKFASTFDVDDWQPVPAVAAIVRTAYFFQQFPFDWGWSKSEQRDLFLQTYALCVKAGVSPGVVDLQEQPAAIDSPDIRPLDTPAKLVIVPCLQQITTQNAAQLGAFVEAGGTAYVSYGGEPWHPSLADFIGTKPRIRYGLVEAPKNSRIELRLTSDFGGLQKGESIALRARGNERRCAMLRCDPKEAEVVAVDSAGQPCLLKRRVGKGQVVFCAYPVEYYLLQGIDANEGDETWRIYRAIFAHAGLPLKLPWTPGVQRFEWTSRSKSGQRRLLFVNHGRQVATIQETPAGKATQIPAKGIRVVDVNERA
jgi:endo-1,4-beta-mannosidase